jgi:polyferredoxin
MSKLGRTTRLIAYDTDLNIKQRIEGKPVFYRLLRMRTVLYAGIIAVVGGVMLYTLATRDTEGISVIHDRNPMYVRLSDGALRNGYTIRIVNKRLKYRDFIVSVDGLSSALIDFVGLPPRADGRQLVTVGPDQTKEVRIVVTDYNTTPPPPSTSILFKLIDIDSGETAEVRDHFFGP